MKKLLSAIFIAAAGISSVSAAKLQHPCLLFTQDQVQQMREKSLSTQWLKDMREVVVKDADSMLSLQTEPYLLEDESKHLYFGIAGRGVQVNVLNLALAGYLTGEQKYIEKAKEVLLAVVRQTEPDNNKNWEHHHQASDAAQGVVLGYDMLYPYMSDSERTEVLNEIEKFGKYLYVSAGVWGTFDKGSTSCNHNSVHHGALGLCALVTGSHQEWLDRAIQRTEGFYTYCADETGYVTEGHHYLSYGFGGAFPFTQALKNLTGYDLFEKYKSLISQAGEQILWNLLPDGGMTVLNDSYSAPVGETVAYSAMLFNKPQQLWAWLKFAEDIPGQKEMNYYEKRAKFYLGLSYTKRGKYFSAPYGLPYTRFFLFLPDAKYTATESPEVGKTPLTKVFQSGRVFMRSGWNDTNDAHVSFTSGYDFHHGHNHRDENSFTFYSLGETFINDPIYWPKYSNCHSTLGIDGKEQFVQFGEVYNPKASMTEGRIQTVREDENGVFVRGEAKGAYDYKEGIDYSNRKLYFVRNAPYSPYVIFRDDAAMRDASEVEFVSRLITKPEHKVTSEGKAAIITTSSGAKAMILTYSGDKQVNVVNDDMKGETFFAQVNGGDFLCTDYFKRLSSTVTAVNPRFTTIVMPYFKKEELPTIRVERRADDVVWTLTFVSGEKHVITLTESDIMINVN